MRKTKKRTAERRRPVEPLAVPPQTGRHRLVVIADLHCGSRTGLTPPDYQKEAFQEETYATYADIMDDLQPIDTLVVNGDCIDVPSLRRHSFDTLESDPDKQCAMAAEAIELARSKNLVITAGTDSHTGMGLELERGVLDKSQLVAAKNGRQYASTTYCVKWDTVIHGKVFNFRHFLNARLSPMSRSGTGTAELVWNALRSAYGLEDRADFLIRSHVHYFLFHGTANGALITTPSLQLPCARYAAKECTGTVDWGVIWFDIYPDGSVQWNYEVKDFGLSRPERVVL